MNSNIKKKEINGYHSFAKNSGWNNTYEDFLLRLDNNKKDICFQHMTNIIKTKTSSGYILDCASGTGWASHIFANNGYNVVAIEMNMSYICGIGFFRANREKMPFNAVLGDCEYMPIKTGKFDIVFCYQALHHTPDVNKMVYEMMRCTKEGGMIIAGGEHIRPFFVNEKKFVNNHPATNFGANEHAYPYYIYGNAFKKAGLCRIKIVPIIDFDKNSQGIIKKFIKKSMILIYKVPIIGEKFVNFLLLNFSDAGTGIIIYGIKK